MNYLGIDLGGTNIVAAVVNEKFEIVSEAKNPTLCPRPWKEILDDVAKTALEAAKMANLKMSDFPFVGIGSPGVISVETGTVIVAVNLGFDNVPLTEYLSKKLGIPVILENDANAAAWGEAVAGAARGTQNSVMITLGTGVGGGVIIGGKVFSGFNYAGTELGHIVIDYNGRQCTCGRRGCWETYSSATALVAMTKEKLDECARTGRKTLMTDIVAQQGKINGRTAPDAMRMGDEAAKEVYDVYVRYLACGLTNIVNIFQPEVISLGCGVSNEGQSLIDAILPIVRAEQYGGDVVELTQLRIAELGNDAGIIGAAALEQ